MAKVDKYLHNKYNFMIPVAGYNKGDIDIPEAIQRLAWHIDNLPERYNKLSAEELHHKPAPDKWSKKEILGHLIDSAINNLKRFTEIQFLPQPYQIISYRQNELVLVNNYQHLAIEHLLLLWQSLNRQIIYVVQNIPANKLEFIVDPQYESKETKTLGWVIADYIAHTEHHFRHIFS
ncbi:MAG: DinB family protein [Chitinophagaceae bacterium]|nr:DinB family protein [Chitinophagaceae bacterium]